MKLQILSDLHIDFCEYIVEHTDSDAIVIAGDIGTSDVTSTMDFLIKTHREHNKPIIVVLGNHDFYGDSIENVKDFYINVKYDWLHVLDNSTVELFDKKISGTTLWTNFDDLPEQEILCQMSMNDFRLIEGFNTKKQIDLYKQSILFLKSCKDSDIIITHYLPTRESVSDKFKNSPLNGCYFSEIEWLIKKIDPSLWVHGHTHDSFDYIQGNTHIVCNPKGYRNENVMFDDRKVVEV